MEHGKGTLENSTVDQKNSKNSQPTVTRFLTHQPKKRKKNISSSHSTSGSNQFSGTHTTIGSQHGCHANHDVSRSRLGAIARSVLMPQRSMPQKWPYAEAQNEQQRCPGRKKIEKCQAPWKISGRNVTSCEKEFLFDFGSPPSDLEFLRFKIQEAYPSKQKYEQIGALKKKTPTFF